MRTRVKICGITRPEDGEAAAQAGADAIGLVFYAKSLRCVELSRAQEICRALPPFISVVALFVDAGNVFARPKDFKLGDIRASYGIGFTWLTPIGALRFSYSKPFHYQARDSLDRFQFTLGAYF